ncbi:hypothetical protein [Brachybacterium paraconglomeratum]|uniref:hypothetical protein n=1 Tax=Brachybacterium paraconglomeratum TaxID=173362 RepID=UPI0031EDFF46
MQREDRPRRDERPRRDDRDSRPSRGRSDHGSARTHSGARDHGRDRPAQEPRDDSRNTRPGQEARADRPIEPRLPESITGKELGKDIQAELRGLSKETAERVSRHMVAAYLLEESDTETAQAHARFAARLGGRVGAVREAHGIIAYRAGDFRTASRELRTSLRITGRTDVLPMIADSERGLGRPERALDIASSEDASDLGVNASIELIIVVAGAYADTGDIETALRTLEIPALRHKVEGRWQVRLWVAYADLLERAGRPDEAKRWLTLAADADSEGVTDAAERLGRPAPQPAEEPTWADDEQISVLDAYDPDADADDSVEAGESADEDDSVEAGESADEDDSVEAGESADEDDSVEAGESADEDDSVEAAEPAAEDDSLEPEEPAVEVDSVDSDDTTVEGAAEPALPDELPEAPHAAEDEIEESERSEESA